ncbi:S9 family peptidase [Erythrobacter sp. HL-111]|uniref:S9 family peptidase n=1 Tax=Erythrobacter sp. HL-111 TaxID=1798193 RepID=UPI0006DB06FF|nr:S9 family peptidase [Erythrobacter sp. HL-111]KPP87955.1 MAG: dipeptidyl aminopeptidase/acylaminoacyl-peptidase family protein [Erythrobacteraceae bacterium HL-111]SDS43718.1 Dipeptidyl aminopeptidase/acylaminoacyl peptidase [Erythrobacter sp. HL-111]
MTRITLLAAALTASVSLAATAASARPMTPEDVAKLEALGAMAVAPDGRSIAYTTGSHPDVTEGEEDGGYRGELKVATGPNEARAYLPDDISPGQVAFAPDGSMVTFLWARDADETAVWGVPVAGGTYRKLAAVPDAGVRAYEIAPDGKAIYMLAGPGPDERREAEHEAGFDAKVYEEEFRPARLFAATIGEEPDENPREIALPGFVSAFDVAPDGERALVLTAPTPLVDDSYTSMRVNLIDLATGEVTAVVETPGKLGDVEWSPDGTQLSLIAAVDMNDPAATTLHLVDAATGEYRALNAGAAEAAVDAEWLDDGRLAAVIHIGARSALRIYDADGALAEEHDPGSLILTRVEAAGGTLAVAADSPLHPSELFVWDSGAPGSEETGKFRRWTTHNPWLAEIDFGRQRRYTYTATDGQEIEGVLIEPVGGAPAGGAPTIMNIHGGPEAHESNGWQTAYSKPGQVAAGQGYAVFLPNYRGSTGYGVAFAKQHQGRYTDPEFRDIVDAKKALVAEGIADPDRTGITGGSYGGYASGWGATYYSDEFAAAVMFVGISNQVSKFGTGDIPNEMHNVHSLAWPWEDWLGMLEVSPVYHVDKANTPILIMHGEDDTRVDPGQSLELYRSIKLRKPEVPVRLVFYPGEGHGNRGAAARYDYNLRMMRWFDTYLKTGDRRAPLPDPRPTLAEGAVATGEE